MRAPDALVEPLCARCGERKREREGDGRLCRPCRRNAIPTPTFHAAPPAPDLTGGPCLSDPDSWDIDAIGRMAWRVEWARQQCKRHCPVLAACKTWTDQLAASRTTRPNGVIQAGVAWGWTREAGRPRKETVKP